MKIAIVYNENDHKLQQASYSQTYRHMFDALIKSPRVTAIQHITYDTNANDIDADCIIIYDTHSSHQIKIDGLSHHDAVKYTYFNDPHQEEMRGRYADGTSVFKLGAEERVKRALSRGVDYIICPYTDGYNQFIAPEVKAQGGNPEDMLVWFPVAPKRQRFNDTKLVDRRAAVLGTGHLWAGRDGFRPYKFRAWAYSQRGIEYVKHCLSDNRIPQGNSFISFIAQWAGAFALTDNYVVPKYLEIPLAGCVCFAQRHVDYDNMGFVDGVNYVMVNKENFQHKVTDFMHNVKEYQQIANAGQQLIEQNFTATHFAEFIYNHYELTLSKKGK